MQKTIAELIRALEAEIISTKAEAESFRVNFLGRKSGAITKLFQRIKEVEPTERGAFGKKMNSLRQMAEARLTAFTEAATAEKASAGADFDLTLPGRKPAGGAIHPLTQTLNEINRIFSGFGFSVEEGPEIEDDWHNFTALNFPPDHPARDMQDTFFIEQPSESTDGIVLRTHTSPVQIRTMENQQPPIKIIAPGRVFRNEAISYKSYCLFHQVEGLYIDENVTMADLKEILHVFARQMFGKDVVMRFRPSFFPFTEPSAEVDIWWVDKSLPAGGKWLEILGCGMVDPNVLESVGIDSEKYSGYAFGMGIDRITMLRHNISDIRLLFENDMRFLEQF